MRDRSSLKVFTFVPWPGAPVCAGEGTDRSPRVDLVVTLLFSSKVPLVLSIHFKRVAVLEQHGPGTRLPPLPGVATPSPPEGRAPSSPWESALFSWFFQYPVILDCFLDT